MTHPLSLKFTSKHKSLLNNMLHHINKNRLMACWCNFIPEPAAEGTVARAGSRHSIFTAMSLFSRNCHKHLCNKHISKI